MTSRENRVGLNVRIEQPCLGTTSEKLIKLSKAIWEIRCIEECEYINKMDISIDIINDPQRPVKPISLTEEQKRENRELFKELQETHWRDKQE